MGKKSNKEIVDQDFLIYSDKDRTIANKNIATGSWTIKQNQIYLNFLKNNSHLFDNEYSRRSTCAFSRIAKKLRRTPEQCRSHHQKFETKGQKDISTLIMRVEQRIKQLQWKQENNHLLKADKKRKRVPKTAETVEFNIPLENNEAFEIYKNEKHWFEIKIQTNLMEQY